MMKAVKKRWHLMMLVALILSPVAFLKHQSLTVVSAATPPPAITSFTGDVWTYPKCSRPSLERYLQVPYIGRNDSNVNPIVAHGSSLDKVTSVTISTSGYVASIASKTATQLKLDIRAASVGEYPQPASTPTLVFSYGNGTSFSKQISPGIIPTLTQDNQAWGQCTWYAAGIARLTHNQSFIKGYSSGVMPSGDPANPGFPQVGSILMTYEKHMSYVETNTKTGQVTNSDGSTTTTYTLTGSQYNGDCKGSKSPFSTTMTVKRSRGGAYTILTLPKVIYTIDRVKQ
ncbi:MAG: hypothetical protein QOE33_479 [Acidobacteriota bacterium]|nr:hypothetical protein [Acidobacteriota bacterium]